MESSFLIARDNLNCAMNQVHLIDRDFEMSNQTKSTADKFLHESNNEITSNNHYEIENSEAVLSGMKKLAPLIEKEKALISTDKAIIARKRFNDLKLSIQLISENLDNFFVISFLEKGKSKSKKED